MIINFVHISDFDKNKMAAAAKQAIKLGPGLR